MRSQFNRPVHCRLFLSASRFFFYFKAWFSFKIRVVCICIACCMARVRRIMKKKKTLLYKQNLVLYNYRKPLFLPIICIIKTVSDMYVCVCVRHHHHHHLSCLCVCVCLWWCMCPNLTYEFIYSLYIYYMRNSAHIQYILLINYNITSYHARYV